MARIQITDLPLISDLSDDQIRGIYGGFGALALKIPGMGSKPILKPLPIKKPTPGSTVKKPSNSSLNSPDSKNGTIILGAGYLALPG